MSYRDLPITSSPLRLECLVCGGEIAPCSDHRHDPATGRRVHLSADGGRGCDGVATTIPALSLWQPWASLVAVRAKQIETRHWATRYRGPVAIHASRRWTNDEVLWLAGNEPAREALLVAGYDWSVLSRHGTSLPLGAVVAVAELRGCVQMTEARIADVPEPERSFGYYAPGRWMWLLGDVRALAMPVPLKGRQGLFQVPRELVAGAQTHVF